VLEVRDTGIGMSAEERARLGEEFFRAKNPRTRAITGTGLGVALVRRIVEGYRGSLEVESVPEEGSVFRVLLPADAERGAGGVAA
jgi:signal transduction histidine kinase